MVAIVFVLVILILLTLGLLELNRILSVFSVQDFVRNHCERLQRIDKVGNVYTLSIFHPNSICHIRVIIAWIAIVIFYFGWSFVGIALYLVSVFMDTVDGMVARKCGLVTLRGEELDPLCDKLTYLAPITYFGFCNILPFPLVVIFLIFELSGQSIVRKIAFSHGWSVAANNFGKSKALLAFSLMPYIFVLENYDAVPDITFHVMIICVVLSCCSAVFKLIPNRFYADILSTLNLSCGVISIGLILNDKLISSVLVVLLGQVFDFFDGRMAVKHGGTKFGPWLDDIADLVSFGFCPALLIWKVSNEWWLAVIAGIFFGCIVFRLIRFVLVDKKRPDHEDYIFFGLPSPAGALIVMGACLIDRNTLMLSLVVMVTSILSVSTYKFVHLGRGIVKKMPTVSIVILSTVALITLAYLVKIDSQVGVGCFLVVGFLFYLMMSEFTKKRLINC